MYVCIYVYMYVCVCIQCTYTRTHKHTHNTHTHANITITRTKQKKNRGDVKLDSHVTCIRELLQANADANAQDCYGRAPLHFAVAFEFEDAVRTLHRDTRVNVDLQVVCVCVYVCMYVCMYMCV